MKRILITGGAGFIPSSLADSLAEDENNSLILVDNLLTGSISNIPKKKNCKFIKCDVNNYNDIAPIMISNQFDYVFHYAAVVGVKRTLDNPIMVLNDINGFRNILDLSKNTNVQRVFFSSSSEVYGEPVEFPQNEETTPLNSRLPYAVVKNIGESFLKSYYKEYGLNYTIFRFFNTYGPKQSADFVVAKFLNAAFKNQDITIYGTGAQTRTFCFIDDNISLTKKILYNSLYLNETINVGSNDEISIKQLAELIIKITDSRSKIVHLPPLEEGDMTRRNPNISKMLEVLNHKTTPLEEGLRKLVSKVNANKQASVPL